MILAVCMRFPSPSNDTTNLIHYPKKFVVRLEPILIELEREQEDLFIIGHASVIRCLLAYLIGLPASEIPAIEIARGDLLEVVPASYGVHSRAFHFWDGPGRRGDGVGDVRDANNFYENYAESTRGKRKIEDFDGHFGGNADQLLKEVRSASATSKCGDDGKMKVGNGMPTITVKEM
jgi:hypothetical protein